MPCISIIGIKSARAVFTVIKRNELQSTQIVPNTPEVHHFRDETIRLALVPIEKVCFQNFPFINSATLSIQRDVIVSHDICGVGEPYQQ